MPIGLPIDILIELRAVLPARRCAMLLCAAMCWLVAVISYLAACCEHIVCAQCMSLLPLLHLQRRCGCLRRARLRGQESNEAVERVSCMPFDASDWLFNTVCVCVRACVHKHTIASDLGMIQFERQRERQLLVGCQR